MKQAMSFSIRGLISSNCYPTGVGGRGVGGMAPHSRRQSKMEKDSKAGSRSNLAHYHPQNRKRRGGGKRTVCSPCYSFSAISPESRSLEQRDGQNVVIKKIKPS